MYDYRRVQIQTLTKKIEENTHSSCRSRLKKLAEKEIAELEIQKKILEDALNKEVEEGSNLDDRMSSWKSKELREEKKQSYGGMNF